ncbi:MAG: hypothetical protein M1833_006691 [Piccolia ochrophora]|nr:MAG: hypothetical protein M1833_006691 [Piccolia ochrophora]
MPRRSLRPRSSTLTAGISSPPSAANTRPRRNASTQGSSVTVARPPAVDPEDPKRSIHLTVKTSSNKLREATSGGTKDPGPIFEQAEIVSGPRGTRAKRAIVDETDSDIDDAKEESSVEPDEVEAEDDEDENGEDDEDDALELEDMDEEEAPEDAQEGSDEFDAEGDVDMEEVPPPLVLKSKAAPPGAKPSVTVTPAQDGPTRTVEEKEMAIDADDDDEDLSELESDEEEDAEAKAAGDLEEEEGDEEDQEMEEDEDEEDEEEDDDSDDDATPASGSRASTPDLSKLTRRQRSRLDEVIGTADLLELPSEPKAKKILSAEEHAMRRAEMARRRKNLSEKRNEEEKMDTINKLLKKQAPKQRRMRAMEAGGDATPNTQDEVEKAKATMIRWVSNREGCRVGVPEEWLGAPLGRVFEPRISGGKMVEEVEAT